MKHLILGSSGQIGSALVEYLKAKNEKYYEFDILREPFEDLRVGSNIALLEKVQNCDIVHFLAYDAGGSSYMAKYQDTYEYIENNILIMQNTFNIIKQYKKPFIFASSQMSNMLNSTYGILKAIGERYTKALKGLYVKFWNVYGNEKEGEKTHVITDFITMAKNMGSIYMRTNGEESRQFLYAEDAAECLYKLALKYDDISRDSELHITNYKWSKIKDIADIIGKEFKCNYFPSEEIDSVQNDKRNEPSKDILKYWKPQTSLKDGIKKIIEQMNDTK